jgi:hypothetical protein
VEPNGPTDGDPWAITKVRAFASVDAYAAATRDGSHRDNLPST